MVKKKELQRKGTGRRRKRGMGRSKDRTDDVRLD
jgi:hypothetical protein